MEPNLAEAALVLVNGVGFSAPNTSDPSTFVYPSGVVPPSESAINAKLAELIAAHPLQELRKKRDTLLAETDWVVIRARENGGTVPAAWKTYRVALRDLPSGLDTVEKVNAVTWPTKPS